jgi:hypothetical protein
LGGKEVVERETEKKKRPGGRNGFVAFLALALRERGGRAGGREGGGKGGREGVEEGT